MLVNKLCSKVRQALFPTICQGCNIIIQAQEIACHKCWQEVELLPKVTICLFPDTGQAVWHPILFKQECDPALLPQFKLPPSKLYSAAQHTGFCKQMVSSLKYTGKIEVAKSMAGLLKEIHGDIFKQYDIIIPIPLHKLRLLARGFNQASELAKHLTKRKAHNFNPHILQRVKNTKPQASLSRKERLQNIQHAFKVNQSYSEYLSNKTILLVDDVYTTGSTLYQAALSLISYNPKQIDMLTFTQRILY